MVIKIIEFLPTIYWNVRNVRNSKCPDVFSCMMHVFNDPPNPTPHQSNRVFCYHLTVLSDFKSCCAIQISQLLLFIVMKANFARFYFSQLDPTCFLRLWTSGKGFHEPFILKISIAVLITYQVIKVLIHKEEFSSCSIQRVKEIHFSY